MDRREAIDILVGMIADNKKYNLSPTCEKENEALDLAIEALEEKLQLSPETSTNCISRQDAIDAMCRECSHSIVGEWCMGDCTEVSLLKNLPPVNQKQITGKLENAENATSESDGSTTGQPKSKLDCISRQQAIEAVTNTIREKFSLADWYEQLVETGKEIEALIKSLPPVAPKPVADCITRQQVTDEIKRWRGYLDEDMIERINTRMNMLPPVTPTVSEDCISRADTIKAMCQECEMKCICSHDCTEVAVVKGMPPVTPPKKVVAQINIDIEELIERIKEEYEITDKVGEWIYGNGHGECSVCKHERQYGWDNYCGNCGAKMR